MNPVATRPIDPLDLAGTDWLLTADEIAVRTTHQRLLPYRRSSCRLS